jgi:hypothetical protein
MFRPIYEYNDLIQGSVLGVVNTTVIRAIRDLVSRAVLKLFMSTGERTGGAILRNAQKECVSAQKCFATCNLFT